MKYIRNLLLNIIFLTIISFAYAQEDISPIFNNDKVYFPLSNITLDIKEDFSNINNGNLDSILIEISYEKIDSIQRIIIMTSQKFANYNKYQLLFFDYHGNLINETLKINGNIKLYILKNENRVLLSQNSLLLTSNESYLFDTNGILINSLIHGYENRFTGISKNEKYIWFISFRMRDAIEGDLLLYPSVPYVPYNRIYIFDSLKGSFIKEIDSESSGLFPIEIEDEIIEIELPQADIPG